MTVYVGDVVWWRVNGRTDVEPWPATVLRIDAGDMLTLHVTNPETAERKVIRNVWEEGHEKLVDNRQLLIHHGMWQLHPRNRATPSVIAPVKSEPSEVEQKKPLKKTELV